MNQYRLKHRSKHYVLNIEFSNNELSTLSVEGLGLSPKVYLALEHIKEIVNSEIGSDDPTTIYKLKSFLFKMIGLERTDVDFLSKIIDKVFELKVENVVV